MLPQHMAHSYSYLQMLENANEIILHGFAYKDFLREIPNPQVRYPSSTSCCADLPYLLHELSQLQCC